jgi:DNA modification methylase
VTCRILQGDCREVLNTLPDNSVHCAARPPYFGLRNYEYEGQIGLEPTTDEFIAAMVEVFREVRRVLRDDGTLRLNVGDSYNAAGRTGHGTRVGFKQRHQSRKRNRG